MQKIIVSYILNFLLRILASYGAGIDWVKTKQQVDAQVKANVPAILDPALESLANTVVDDFQLLLQDTEGLKAVLERVTEQDWQGAIDALFRLAQRIFNHPTYSQKLILKALKPVAV